MPEHSVPLSIAGGTFRGSNKDAARQFAARRARAALRPELMWPKRYPAPTLDFQWTRISPALEGRTWNGADYTGRAEVRGMSELGSAARSQGDHESVCGDVAYWRQR